MKARFHLCLAASVFLVLCLAPKSAAQTDTCFSICGDLNSSNTVTSADIINMVHWVGWTGYVGNIACGDVDGFANLNVRDHAWMAEYVFRGGPAPMCPPDSGTYQPAPASDVQLMYNNVFPAGDTLVRVQLDLVTGRPFNYVSLLLRTRVDDSSAFIAPVATSTSNIIDNAEFNIHTVVTDQFHGRGTDALSGVWGSYANTSLPPGRHPLAFFDLIMPSSSDYRTISIELFSLPDFVNDVPMIVDSSLVGWAITPVGRIADPLGDVNLDRKVTSADIIYSVNYCFKGGPAPLPLVIAGDVNCSGTQTSADIIGLVNYIFKSGTPPCDIHSECTVNPVNWQLWDCP